MRNGGRQLKTIPAIQEDLEVALKKAGFTDFATRKGDEVAGFKVKHIGIEFEVVVQSVKEYDFVQLRIRSPLVGWGQDVGTNTTIGQFPNWFEFFDQWKEIRRTLPRQMMQAYKEGNKNGKSSNAKQFDIVPMK